MVLFPELFQYHVSYDTLARPQLPSIVSHETPSRLWNRNRYNAHYLSQLFFTTTRALQYIWLDCPALLFVGREERSRERLTTGPIGRIVTLAAQVTRPPNAPVSMYFASALSTVRSKVGPEAKRQCPPREHIPFKEKTRPARQELERDPEATSPCLCGIFRQSPNLGTTRPSEPKTPSNKENLGVSSPRVTLPRDMSTSGSIIQEPVPPRHEPVSTSREYTKPPRVN